MRPPRESVLLTCLLALASPTSAQQEVEAEQQKRTTVSSGDSSDAWTAESVVTVAAVVEQPQHPEAPPQLVQGAAATGRRSGIDGTSLLKVAGSALEVGGYYLMARYGNSSQPTGWLNQLVAFAPGGGPSPAMPAVGTATIGNLAGVYQQAIGQHVSQMKNAIQASLDTVMSSLPAAASSGCLYPREAVARVFTSTGQCLCPKSPDCQ